MIIFYNEVLQLQHKTWQQNKMAQLHNRISRKELKERIQNDSTPRITISFYSYFKIVEPSVFRNTLYKDLKALDVMGRIYLAHEGINSQISLPSEKMDAFKNYLYAIEPLNGLRLNIAVDDDGKSFYVLDSNIYYLNARVPNFVCRYGSFF